MDFILASPMNNPRERRDQIKKEIENLSLDLPFKFEKISQLRILKAICTFIKKEKHFREFKEMFTYKKILGREDFYEDNIQILNQTYINEVFCGFIVCFKRNGELIYFSENINDYFGFNALDTLFAYDNISEIVCKEDYLSFSDLEQNYNKYSSSNQFTFFTSWYVSKIQKKNILTSDYKQLKMTGHYDNLTDMFIASCVPILSINNRDILVQKDPNCFLTLHKLNLQFIDPSKNLNELLGYYSTQNFEPNLYKFLSPDSLEPLLKIHRDLLTVKNTRGYMLNIKLIHKNGFYLDDLMNIYYDSRGFIACVHQIMKKDDMENYTLYVSKLEQKKNLEFLNSSENYTEFNYAEESLLDITSMKKLDNENRNILKNNLIKRKINEDNETEKKKAKNECEFNDNYDQNNYCKGRINTNDLKDKVISKIENSLKKAIQLNNCDDKLLEENKKSIQDNLISNNETFSQYFNNDKSTLDYLDLEDINIEHFNFKNSNFKDDLCCLNKIEIEKIENKFLNYEYIEQSIFDEINNTIF